MGRDYFREYLKIAPLSHALWRSQEAKAVSEITMGNPMLDLGCGFGEFAGVFFNNMIEVGIDISKKDLLKAVEQKKYKNLIWADARKLPFDNNFFSTIISISTLEHIENVNKVISEVFRVLKIGGLFIFTIPTSELNKRLIAPKFFKNLDLNFLANLYLKIYHYVFKHKVIVPKNNWLRMLKKKGFKIILTKGTLSEKQILTFELFLIPAGPTQIFRRIFNKRLPFSPDFRVKILGRLFREVDNETPNCEANILIIAQK